MPMTLPVPSKGALRTLRHLALGTSCTVAFSAGVLTEDRRRRIHAAREVHDNARKLKSARNYHSAAATALFENFEEQSFNLHDDALWLPSNVARSKTSLSKETNKQDETQVVTKADPAVSQLPRRTKLPALTVPPISPKSFSGRPASRSRNTKTNENHEAQLRKETQCHRQEIFHKEVTKLLAGQSPDVGAAAARFLGGFGDISAWRTHDEAFSEDPSQQRVVDLAARLCIACMDASYMDGAIQIFKKISRLGPLNEQDYFAFQPWKMITSFLKGLDRDNLDSRAAKVKIEQASSIYLMEVTETSVKTKGLLNTLVNTGKRLCDLTCAIGLHELTINVHARMRHYAQDGPPAAMDALIKARYHQGNYEMVSELFTRFYTKTRPGKLELYKTTSIVIDSLLRHNKVDLAVEALKSSVPMAKAARCPLSTTVIMKVLGHHWRTSRNIFQTRILFEQLEPLAKLAGHPQAVYVAIMQFCVEADDDIAAEAYFEVFKNTYTIGPKDSRIYGHFALARAKRGEWDDVKKLLSLMRQCNPDDEDGFGACFVPVLKLYLSTHSIMETEEFLRHYIEVHQLKMSMYIMNLVIDAYGKAKEIDSIARWIQYCGNSGVSIDSASLNTILQTLIYRWNFSLNEAILLYDYRGLSSNTSLARLVDETTMAILRRSATRDSPDDTLLFHRHRRLTSFENKFNVHMTSPCSDAYSVLESMTALFNKNNYLGALRLYKHAKGKSVCLDARHLSLAVRASLSYCTTGIDEALGLIRDAQESIDVGGATAEIFVHQLSRMLEEGEINNTETSANNLIALATITVESFERAGLKVRECIITHSLSLLDRTGHRRQAIEFLVAMSQRLNISPESWSAATYTVLGQLYIGLRDCSGIRWTIETIRSNRIVPDLTMYHRFKDAQRKALRLVESRPHDTHLLRFFECVVDARDQLKQLRADHMEDKATITAKVAQIIRTAIEEQNSASREIPLQQGSLTPIPGFIDDDLGSETVMEGEQDLAWQDIEDVKDRSPSLESPRATNSRSRVIQATRPRVKVLTASKKEFKKPLKRKDGEGRNSGKRSDYKLVREPADLRSWTR